MRTLDIHTCTQGEEGVGGGTKAPNFSIYIPVRFVGFWRSIWFGSVRFVPMVRFGLYRCTEPNRTEIDLQES